MKLKSFTLIEMLVTLTLFAMSMMVIYNLMASALSMINNMNSGDSARTAGTLLAKVLDSTLRDSHNIYLGTNNSYIVESADNIRHRLTLKNKICIIDELKNRQLINKRVFNMETAERVEMRIIDDSARKGLDLSIDFKGSRLHRIIILGYRRRE